MGLKAGNPTGCFNRGVLNTISSEIRKCARLHDNVLMEVVLTRKIMQMGDTYSTFPDPFATPVNNETGAKIVGAHFPIWYKKEEVEGL